jgi:hypothetical protein
VLAVDASAAWRISTTNQLAGAFEVYRYDGVSRSSCPAHRSGARLSSGSSVGDQHDRRCVRRGSGREVVRETIALSGSCCTHRRRGIAQTPATRALRWQSFR